MSSRFPAVPDFTDNDPSSMTATLRALQRSVEILTGQQQGVLSTQVVSFPTGAAMVFLSPQQPININNNSIRSGDFWVQVIDTSTVSIYVWTGARWLKVSA